MFDKSISEINFSSLPNLVLQARAEKMGCLGGRTFVLGNGSRFSMNKMLAYIQTNKIKFFPETIKELSAKLKQLNSEYEVKVKDVGLFRYLMTLIKRVSNIGFDRIKHFNSLDAYAQTAVQAPVIKTEPPAQNPAQDVQKKDSNQNKEKGLEDEETRLARRLNKRKQKDEAELKKFEKLHEEQMKQLQEKQKQVEGEIEQIGSEFENLRKKAEVEAEEEKKKFSEALKEAKEKAAKDAENRAARQEKCNRLEQLLEKASHAGDAEREEIFRETEKIRAELKPYQDNFLRKLEDTMPKPKENLSTPARTLEVEPTIDFSAPFPTTLPLARISSSYILGEDSRLLGSHYKPSFPTAFQPVQNVTYSPHILGQDSQLFSQYRPSYASSLYFDQYSPSRPKSSHFQLGGE